MALRGDLRVPCDGNSENQPKSTEIRQSLPERLLLASQWLPVQACTPIRQPQARCRLNRSIDTRMLALVFSVPNVRATRRDRPVGGAAKQLSRLAVWLRVGAAAMLLAFHAVLLWTHLLSGRLFEPAVALRWGIGLLLLGLLWALRRAGVPLLWGRRALVVWVLVALLHVSAARPATADSMTTSPVDETLSMVVLPPTAGLIFTAGLLLFGALIARRWRVPAPAGRTWHSPVRPRLRSATTSPRLAPRAPPIPASC